MSSSTAEPDPPKKQAGPHVLHRTRLLAIWWVGAGNKLRDKDPCQESSSVPAIGGTAVKGELLHPNFELVLGDATTCQASCLRRPVSDLCWLRKCSYGLKRAQSSKASCAVQTTHPFKERILSS